MKLSELSTDRAADVLCEVTPYIANITGDKALLDELAIKFDSKGKSVAELYTFSAHKYAQLVPSRLVSCSETRSCWIFSNRLGGRKRASNPLPASRAGHGGADHPGGTPCPHQSGGKRTSVPGLCNRRLENHRGKHGEIRWRFLYEGKIPGC